MHGVQKKAPPVAGGAGEKTLPNLENNLRSELQVERFARTQPRRSVEVADRVTHRAIPAHRTCPRRQVYTVEQIEHFRADLYFQTLRNGDVFDHRQVHIGKAWAGEGISAHVAVRVGRARATCSPRNTERCRVDPWLTGFAAQILGECVGDPREGVGYQVQAWPLRPRLVATGEVERLSAME